MGTILFLPILVLCCHMWYVANSFDTVCILANSSFIITD